MTLSNDAELEAFAAEADRFAHTRLTLGALAEDHYPFAPLRGETLGAASELGLVDLMLPEDLGGSGLGPRAFGAVLGPLAKVDASQAVLLFTQALGRTLLAELTPTAYAERWLSTSAPSGQRPTRFAFPLYDDPDDRPDCVVATPTDDGFVLNGESRSVACLPDADLAIVFCRCAEEAAPAPFLISTSAGGAHVSAPVPALGLRACPMADLGLDRVVVPREHRLGASDGALHSASLVDRFRIPLVAIALGVLEGSLRLALEYARERRQSKKLIVEHDMVRRMLAEMSAWLDLGQGAVSAACESLEQGRPSARRELLSTHELIVTAVTRATTDGVQLLGGNGYMHEYGQEKRMRDAKQLQAIFGSSPVRVQHIADRRLADS